MKTARRSREVGEARTCVLASPLGVLIYRFQDRSFVSNDLVVVAGGLTSARFGWAEISDAVPRLERALLAAGLSPCASAVIPLQA